MEEIKLPKFKTKEELEQFAMGLMTEIESLKHIIHKKDESFSEVNINFSENARLKTELAVAESDIRSLKQEIEALKEQTYEGYYKDRYEEELGERKCLEKENHYILEKLNTSKRRICKLCDIVQYLLGMLPRLKYKRFEERYGEFHPDNYRSI
jgi:hypothetical protein